MGRVFVGRLCYGPRLQWVEFAMGRDVQLPIFLTFKLGDLHVSQLNCVNRGGR